jgi:hypothetical protein
MPRFVIELKYPIQHEDHDEFKEFIFLQAKISKHLRNLKYSSAYEGGFSFPGKCDIRYCCTVSLIDSSVSCIRASCTNIKYKSAITSLCSKECSPFQQEWTSDELNEFSSIVQSYFTVLTVMLD